MRWSIRRRGGRTSAVFRNDAEDRTDRVTALRALYISYLGLDDPLVETQVVAYLEGLSQQGHHVHLLTFERGRLTERQRQQRREELRARGVSWHDVTYHKRPSLLATAVDVVAGAVTAGLIMRRYRLRAIHARSHVPAAMALILNWVASIPFIFDIRGLMAEEYVDAGRWPPGGIAVRITKAVERSAVRRATAIVVLTNRVRDHLFGDRQLHGVHVIPCCADIERIASQRSRRETIRERLGLSDRVVLIYVGKFSGWYMEREMVDFFAEARQREPRLHFHVVTQHERAAIIRQFERAGVADNAYSVLRVQPEEVGEHLAAADAAISFIRKCPSKISSSPTKIGEYLAAGLPIVTTAGIGDLDELIGQDGIGILIDRFDGESYARIAAQLWATQRNGAAATRRMKLAEDQLSLRRVGIPAYDQLYRAVAVSVAQPAQ